MNDLPETDRHGYDPPENLDFLALPEHVQACVAERFERGTELTHALDNAARRDLHEQAAKMRRTRALYDAREAERRERATTARRANKASLADYGLSRGKR